MVKKNSRTATKRTTPRPTSAAKSPGAQGTQIIQDIRENAISYLKLRSYIGFLAIGLPFAVSLGARLFFGEGPQGSISGYYYTDMRTVFVGALWAIGFFLFSYPGHETSDRIPGILGGFFAIGISLFPTTPDGPATSQQQLIGLFHFIFATLFFLTLIYFSVFLFTKTHPGGKPAMTPRKQQRNRVYIACGVIMAVCIVISGIFAIPSVAALPFTMTYHPIFLMEALADVAFGVSWITKGEVILKDEKL